MQFFGFVLLLVLVSVQGQHAGTQQKEEHPQFSIQQCTSPYVCTSESGGLVMDGNWRWTHKVGTYQPNCFDGKWNPDMCPDPATCTKNCAIDGIGAKQYTETYGVKSDGTGVTLDFVTKSNGKNVGSRIYLLDDDKNYKLFKLINKEFTFDVDVSKLGCGLNGAVYFVEMDQDGGMSKYPTNKAGAAYGTGYCDAQCPHDIKWIYGTANLGDADKNFDGHYGSCCSEMDIWEANSFAAAFTPHPCAGEGRVRCEGSTCNSTCDSAGCDFNNYRLGNKTFYMSGGNIDTTKSFSVVTQFISSDGTDDGDLKEIKRFYVQDGNKITNANSQFSMEGTKIRFNSLTDDNCALQKKWTGDTNIFQQQGGMKKMGEAMKRGMVLVMSLWDDHEAYMLWLDSSYPVDATPTDPGVTRGPCDPSSGRPDDVETKQADANVKYSNIKFGAIGSTYFH